MSVIRPLVRAAAVAAPLALIAAPVQAQDSPFDETELAPLAEKLGDPALQESMAQTAAVLSEALLDLPLAPLARAAAQAAGEDPEAVDPQMTLRRVAPGAERVPEELSDRVPQMMGAMAGMAEGIQAMLPALRQMAEQMKDRFADSRAQRD